MKRARENGGQNLTPDGQSGVVSETVMLLSMIYVSANSILSLDIKAEIVFLILVVILSKR